MGWWRVGTYVSFYAGFVDYLVDVIGRDAWFDLSCSYVKNFS